MSLDTLLQRADIWRAGESLQRHQHDAIATGIAELNQALPGGGWPEAALTELLLDHHGIGELQLLMPALARLSRAGRWLAWVASPHLPYPPALASAGITLSRLLCIQPKRADETLWATEQSLRSGLCGAVLSWPERLNGRALRRLQLAAESGRTMGVLFRPLKAAGDASPAALRLKLTPAPGGMTVEILKRRGGWARAPIFIGRRE